MSERRRPSIFEELGPTNCRGYIPFPETTPSDFEKIRRQYDHERLEGITAEVVASALETLQPITEGEAILESEQPQDIV